MIQFENIIIGAGPGGYELAAALARRGESVLIIEKNKLGGTCLNCGCIPTKCLAASASVAETVNKAASFGISADPAKVDAPAVFERMHRIVDNLRNGVKQELSKCTVCEGEAILSSQNTVKVNDEEYQATKRMVIATGSKPSLLPIEGAELAVTSDDVLRMDFVPNSIVIIGGGVIGMEFASIFNALGSKVTVVEYCKEILPPFDPETAKRLRTSLSRKGIDIVVGACVTKIESDEATGAVTVTYEGKKGSVNISADKAVMAVGRKPVLPNGIENIGVELTEKGFIKVNEKMETSVQGVYAIGDVNGLSMLAHSAIAQGKVISFNDSSLFNALRVPSIVFTIPEVAMVGRTAEQLKDAGIETETVKHLYASNGKANAMGAPEGFVKFVCDKETSVIRCVSIIGEHAADLIAEATIAVTDSLTISELENRYIHSHPTLSELF